MALLSELPADAYQSADEVNEYQGEVGKLYFPDGSMLAINTDDEAELPDVFDQQDEYPKLIAGMGVKPAQLTVEESKAVAHAYATALETGDFSALRPQLGQDGHKPL